jgi:prepilin signal peptidase PulO-like enzyme (type II secretory pathway)
MLQLQTLVFCAGLLGAAFYDIKYRLVDDRVCILIGLAGLMTISPASFWGAVFGALPFYIGSGLGKNGAGDICLAAAAGFVLGSSRTLAGLSLFCALYAIFLVTSRLVTWLRGKPMITSCPLVPFLAAGFIPAYFFA